MTKLLEPAALRDLLPSAEETWVVRWVTYDATFLPFYCGVRIGPDGPEHGWSACIANAQRYPSRAAALCDEELSDYWDGGDIEAVAL